MVNNLYHLLAKLIQVKNRRVGVQTNSVELIAVLMLNLKVL